MIELILPVVPLLALVVSLLFGFYPGCETVVRLADRIASRAATRATAALAALRPRPPAAHAVQGGLLLAFSLSGRAPPARVQF